MNRWYAGDGQRLFTRRQLVALLGAGAVGLVGLLAYAFGVEPHRVELVTRPMPLRALPPARAGRTLHVDRGLGHLTRVRFDVRPEVTLFTLRADA